MHVLFVTGEFPPMQGGVGDCTNEIANALQKLDVEVAVLTTNDERRMTNEIAKTPISNLLVSLSETTPISIFRIVPRWNWSALPYLRHALSVTQADILHIQYQTAAFGMHPMINFAPRLLNLYPFSPSPRGRGGWGARSVVTFHDLLPMYLFPKAGRLRDWVTFQLARGSDAVIATNESDHARLERELGKPVSLIPIGSNIEPMLPPDYDRAAWRAKLSVAADEILLCYFGFLNESKGGETLIRALAELPNAKLLMIGGQVGASDATNAAYLKKVKRLISDLKLETRVIWTNFVAAREVSANFMAADVCVLPYRDGASYRRGTFMAALAHGMAIVTTDDERRTTNDERRRTQNEYGKPSSVDEMGEWARRPAIRLSALSPLTALPPLRDGENVLLVPPDDPHAIAAAVSKIVALPELRARLQDGARTTAAYFTWDNIAEQHLALYKSLLDE